MRIEGMLMLQERAGWPAVMAHRGDGQAERSSAYPQRRPPTGPHHCALAVLVVAAWSPMPLAERQQWWCRYLLRVGTCSSF